MESGVKEMRARHKKEIKELQSICPHTKYSWMNEEWAPAHSTGRIVKVCENCDKELEAKGGFIGAQKEETHSTQG